MRLYVHIFNGKEWWLIPLMVLLAPITMLGWLLSEFMWGGVYLFGFFCCLLDGMNVKAAHYWISSDIRAMRSSKINGGY